MSDKNESCVEKMVFLTMMIPKELYTEVYTKSKNTMQDAANELQNRIYEGLCSNTDTPIQIINKLPIDSFPQYYKDFFIANSAFSTVYNEKNVNLGFCNIKLLRNYLLPNVIYSALCKEFRDVDKGTLFVYSASPVFVDALDRFKRKTPHIKICLIIADLPNMTYLSSHSNVIKDYYINKQAQYTEKKLQCVDYFVLLTKQMADYLKITKPFCVVEGIAKDNSYSDNYDTDDNIKTIMYSGTLHKRFGILNLLSAFTSVNKENYRLLICGVGDCEEIIKKVAQNDKRIAYLGQIKRDEVISYQQKATVLVNPRQNNEEFTKYSFPSKTMEYLVSGKPVIAYKLEGIPDEYDKYLCYVHGNSVQNLQKKIEEICELSKEERKQIGLSGREFVLANKNSKMQTAKIIDMLNYNDY